jgi:hypothetical protein
MSTIGLLHPGAMGASVGAALARPGQASALKMAFAAWSKGSTADGLPPSFHAAAAQIFERLSELKTKPPSFEAVLEALLERR